MTSDVGSRRSSVCPAGDQMRVVLVCGGAEVASWPLAAWRGPDLAVVDELARWQLAARRLGCSIRLRDASAELSELLDLVGLGDVVRSADLEAGGEAEGGEQGGVQEVVMPDDPVA
ncbi:MAG: hypothetical protein ACRDTX_09330 [Pseudonocardiaceae bacterium]